MKTDYYKPKVERNWFPIYLTALLIVVALLVYLTVGAFADENFPNPVYVGGASVVSCADVYILYNIDGTEISGSENQSCNEIRSVFNQSGGLLPAGDYVAIAYDSGTVVCDASCTIADWEADPGFQSISSFIVSDNIVQTISEIDFSAFYVFFGLILFLIVFFGIVYYYRTWIHSL